jgi:hypothetical protein
MKSSLRVRSLAGILGVFLMACSSSEDGVEKPDEQVAHVREATTSVVEVPFLPDTIPGGYAICATGTLKINDRAQVLRADGTAAPIMSLGTATTEIGADAKTGFIWSKGPVFLRERATITGGIMTGGALSTQNGTSVSGTIQQNANLTVPTLRTLRVTVPPAGANVDLEPNQTRDLQPGSYGNVMVKAGATLRVGSGPYYVTSLSLEPNSTLIFNSENGPLQLFVRSSYIHRGRIVDVASASPRVLVAYLGTGSVPLEAPFSGTLLAPNGTVQLASVTLSHNSEILAKNLELFEGSRFVFNRLTPLGGEEALRAVLLGSGRARQLLPELWGVDPISRINLSAAQIADTSDLLAAKFRAQGMSPDAANTLQRIAQIARADGASAAALRQRVQQALTENRQTATNLVVGLAQRLQPQFLAQFGRDMQSNNRVTIDAAMRNAPSVILELIRYQRGVPPSIYRDPSLGPIIDVGNPPPNFPFVTVGPPQTGTSIVTPGVAVSGAVDANSDFTGLDPSLWIEMDIAAVLEIAVVVFAVVAAVVVIPLQDAGTNPLTFDTMVDTLAPRLSDRVGVLQTYHCPPNCL